MHLRPHHPMRVATFDLRHCQSGRFLPSSSHHIQTLALHIQRMVKRLLRMDFPIVNVQRREKDRARQRRRKRKRHRVHPRIARFQLEHRKPKVLIARQLRPHSLRHAKPLIQPAEIRSGRHKTRVIGPHGNDFERPARRSRRRSPKGIRPVTAHRKHLPQILEHAVILREVKKLHRILPRPFLDRNRQHHRQISRHIH